MINKNLETEKVFVHEIIYYLMLEVFYFKSIKYVKGEFEELCLNKKPIIFYVILRMRIRGASRKMSLLTTVLRTLRV